MKKVLVFGSGKYYAQKKNAIEGEIIGFVDNIKVGEYEGKRIYRVDEIVNVQYDYIYIMVGAELVGTFVEQCLDAGVDIEKILIGQNLQPRIAWENIYLLGDNPIIIDKEGMIFDSGKIKCRVYDPHELISIAEMIGGNVYGYTTNMKDNVVVDIGMNIGVASLYFASREDVCKVYSYEPFARTYKKAISNMKLNSKMAEKIVATNAGMSNEAKKEKVIFNDCMNEALTTCPDLVEKTVDYYANNCTYEKTKEIIEEVQLLDAADEISIILEENEKKNFILKIDCEGSEYEIMEELEKNKLLERFSIIMLEYHYRGSEVLKARLKNAGFTFFEFVINEYFGTIYAVKSVS